MTAQIPFYLKCRAKVNPEKTISLTAFAQKYGIHKSTAYSWIRQTKIYGYKHAGQWYIYDSFTTITQFIAKYSVLKAAVFGWLAQRKVFGWQIDKDWYIYDIYTVGTDDTSAPVSGAPKGSSDSTTGFKNLPEVGPVFSSRENRWDINQSHFYSMAAAITTTATTLEGQLLEISRALQQAELSVTATARPNRITLTPNLEDGELAITATLPITLGGTGNALQIQANTYLA